MNQFKSVSEKDVQTLRAKTDAEIQKILSAPNMKIPAGATVFYVSATQGKDENAGTDQKSAWKTVDRVNAEKLPAGSFVCFKRGDVWRHEYLIAQSGVTYTAYGEGEKPKFYGSPEDGADPSKWQEVAPNIWYYEGSEQMGDVGAIIFDGGRQISTKVTIYADKDFSTGKIAKFDLANYNFVIGEGKRKFEDYRDLCTDLQLFHDSDYKLCFFNRENGAVEEYSYTGSRKLYLYSKENPGKRFSSMEFCVSRTLFNASADGVTVDNLCFKFGGCHGVGASGNVTPVKNLTVQNCEFGWLGGSAQREHMGRPYQTRLGNAVEIYGACENFTVQNNYIYQIYDTGMTAQADPANVNPCIRQCLNMKNVKYLFNVIENCEMAFEIWENGIEKDNPSRMENYLVEGNRVWNTSYGFCEQRPVVDRGWSAAVKNRCANTGNRAYNYVIKNNLFAYWKNRALQCTSNLFNPEDGSDSLPNLSHNVYVEKKGKKFGQFEVVGADLAHLDATFDESVTEYLDSHTTEMSGAYVKPGHCDHTDEFWFVD